MVLGKEAHPATSVRSFRRPASSGIFVTVILTHSVDERHHPYERTLQQRPDRERDRAHPLDHGRGRGADERGEHPAGAADPAPAQHRALSWCGDPHHRGPRSQHPPDPGRVPGHPHPRCGEPEGRPARGAPPRGSQQHRHHRHHHPHVAHARWQHHRHHPGQEAIRDHRDDPHRALFHRTGEGVRGDPPQEGRQAFRSACQQPEGPRPGDHQAEPEHPHRGPVRVEEHRQPQLPGELHQQQHERRGG